MWILGGSGRADCDELLYNPDFWRASIVSILFLLGSVSLVASSVFFIGVVILLAIGLFILSIAGSGDRHYYVVYRY